MSRLLLSTHGPVRVALSFIAASEAETVYVQTLERVYIDDQSRRIMLSLAYGDRQEGSLQAHRPEFCFKAPGLSIGRPARPDVQLW